MEIPCGSHSGVGPFHIASSFSWLTERPANIDMLLLAAAAGAWNGAGGALRPFPKLNQAHANDARLHILGAVHRAARHTALRAQEPALLREDELLASLRRAGVGGQTGFTKVNDESAYVDSLLRGPSSSERPGSYGAGSIASRATLGGPA